MKSTDPPPIGLPIYSAQFTKPELRVVHPVFSPIQQAVFPVVGLAGSQMRPYGTAFCISVKLSMALTAWHVVEEFIDQNEAGLQAGTCRLAVMVETNQTLPGGGHLGYPVPVWRVTHVLGTDLAVLQLYEHNPEHGPTLAPARLEISFQQPEVGEWCYGFGYPVLAGGTVTTTSGRPSVPFRRTLHVTAGRVLDVFPNGHGASGGRLAPGAPLFVTDAPCSGGMSGGPVQTDSAGLCGLLSTSYDIDPEDPNPDWTTLVSMFPPLLGCTIDYHNGSPTLVSTTIRDLAEAGFFGVQGELPPAPTVEIKRFDF